ncbi:hypothetical protein ACIQ9Q_42070 [Streptomyces sp. NPDC094438]|uniref:hypothetical protein n=1 Tax=Streptomyces sp. NPDC094438 TaxID=3366061 RepID=UPI00380E049C
MADLLERQTHDRGQWATVDDELARYGMSVLHSWFADSSVGSRVHRLTGQMLRLDSRLARDSDAVSELIGTTIAVSLHHFRRRALAGTGWQPHRGASARTYFVGRCLLALPGEHRRFIREQLAAGPPSLPLYEAAHAMGTDPFSRPEDLALAHCTVVTILNQADPRTRHALVGVMYGLPLPTIAAALGTTTKSVEMLLYRHRHRLRTAHPTPRQPAGRYT